MVDAVSIALDCSYCCRCFCQSAANNSRTITYVVGTAYEYDDSSGNRYGNIKANLRQQ